MKLALWMPLLGPIGCGLGEEPATAIVVSVKTDLRVGSELRTLTYRVFHAYADPELDRPVAEFTAAAQTLAHPFVILKQRDDELLLSVEGFNEPADDPLVVQRVRVRFERNESLALHVFLARACAYAFCQTDGLTCFGQDYGWTSAGECAAIPGPWVLDPVREPGDESTWLPMSHVAYDLDAGSIKLRDPDSGL